MDTARVPLRRLNLLAGVPNRREVVSWAMYDLANQSFTVLINTVFFALYFKEHVVRDPVRGQALWGYSVGASNLAVLLCAPVFGAMADHAGAKKRALLALTVACVSLTALLGLVTPAFAGAVATMTAVYIAANFCFASAESFVSAFLPEIAPPGAIARVSAFGWTLGYVGTLLVLPASLLIVGTDGVSAGEHRRVFLFAAAWFGACSIPTFLFLRERAVRPGAGPGPSALRAGFSRLAQTARGAARHRQLLRFLGAFAVYSCGTQTVIYFANIVAKDQFGFSDTKLILFMLQLGLAAGVGALVSGALHARIGHRGVVVLNLCLWIGATLGAAIVPKVPAYEWAFWLVGNGVGLALGGVGTASRAMVGALTPTEKSAEFFGLWSLAYRLAGVVGPAAFGALSAARGSGTALLLVVAFFALGLVGVAFVDEREGERAATGPDPTA